MFATGLGGDGAADHRVRAGGEREREEKGQQQGGGRLSM